jgi:hypothetical protein
MAAAPMADGGVANLLLAIRHLPSAIGTMNA